MPSVYHDAPQTDFMFCGAWRDTFFTPLKSLPSQFPVVSGVPFATPVTSDALHGCGGGAAVASVSVVSIAVPSPWNMSSAAIFSAPVLPTQSTSATLQPVSRLFQPQIFPNVGQASVKFTGGLTSDCGGLGKAVAVGDDGKETGCGDEPLGKRFFPCWHSVASSSSFTSTVFSMPQTGAATKCLNASSVVTTSAAAANTFSPVKTATESSLAAADSAVPNCRHQDCANDVDDDDEDEDDDDESVSDESSSASNQKEGGKYCECWRCEFFGHADVRIVFAVWSTTKRKCWL